MLGMAHVALLSLISAPAHTACKPAGPDGFRSSRSSHIFRWQLLTVPLTAWYLERTVQPQDFARTAPELKGLVLPNTRLPQATADDDLAVEDALAGGTEALRRSENWCRPEKQLPDQASAHAANYSCMLPAAGCSPAATVNGRTLAGEGGSAPTWTCPAPACNQARGGGRFVSYATTPRHWTHHWNKDHFWMHGALEDFEPEPEQEEPEPAICQPCTAAPTSEAAAITGIVNNALNVYGAMCAAFIHQLPLRPAQPQIPPPWPFRKFDHHTQQATVQRCKDGMAEQCALKTAAIVAKLAPHVGADVDLAALIEPIMNAESQIYTSKREASARRQVSAATHPPMTAHPRALGVRKDGTTAYAYDVKLEDVTMRDLQYDPQLYDDVVQSNARWALSNVAADADREISDLYHGTEWRAHADLGSATVGQVHPTLAWQLYADGVDVVNAIGHAAGHHHMTFVYTSLINRDPAARTRQVAINLACIVMSKDMKYFTPAAVISGLVDEPTDSTSLGASLRKFATGVPLQVPGQGGITFLGWLFNFVGDAPAVAEMAGTKQSFSKAKNICNMCENACMPAIKSASAFLGCNCVDDRNHAPGCNGKFALRTAARDAIHKPSADARAMLNLGVDTWEHAFVRIPNGGRSLAQQPGPKDAMHVWMEGITKTSAAATLFMMVRVHQWCTKEELRDRSRKFAWPKEKAVSRPGFIPEKIFKGTVSSTAPVPGPAPTTGRGRATGDVHGRGRGGRSSSRGRGGGRGRGAGRAGARPHKDTTMPFTAHHMLVWALHSVELLRPFLPENAMEFAFWRAWVHQVDILSCMMAPVFTRASLLRLESTLDLWFTTVFDVPEYVDFWVPKYHFALHLAHDIWRFGPPRLNWCFGYEAKNQPLKRGAKRSNFKNVAKATAEFWCQSSDHHLQAKRACRRPATEPGEVIKRGTAATFPSMQAQLKYMASALGLADDTSFSFLGSIACHSQHLIPQGYAFITDTSKTPAEPASLCKVDHIVVANQHIYTWVTVYPASVLTYDAYGVLHIPGASLEAAAGQCMLFSVETHTFAPLWHFAQSDGSFTFVSKW